MPSIADFVEPAFRLFTVAEMTARYLSLILLVVGLIGYFTAKANSRRVVRYRGMITGSAAALVAIIGLSAFYDLVAFVMGGSVFLPAGWPYGSAGSAGLLPIAQAASGMLSYIGLACFSLGAALWAAGTPRGRTWTRGYHGILWGLAMIGVSMGGLLFTTLIGLFGL
ncbi:hypothetical protein DU504_16365 [Haloplanus salinus]|uniref:Uncharacterized protein n=1 Tax=Haloplanus salinus TaxID=1126245 RepID=A0A368N1I2_9EURY|nr:hypothetical protein [Haloplanus salinus]RCU44338.1 hypothetical protein DU504_16365 [Haloplanus salinus]